MPKSLPRAYLVRNGETAWGLSGQHTRRTDLPLTPRSEADARRLGQRLSGIAFERVFTSPLARAQRTCELAGFGSSAVVDPDLLEWDYGACAGKTRAEICSEHPGWEIFRDGCPGGESLAQVVVPADRVITRLRAIGRDTLVFSSGHILRVLAVRWRGTDGAMGRYLLLDPVGLSVWVTNTSSPSPSSVSGTIVAISTTRGESSSRMFIGVGIRGWACLFHLASPAEFQSRNHAPRTRRLPLLLR